MVVRLRPGQINFYPGEPTLFVIDPGGPVLRDLDRRMTRVQVGARAKVRIRSGLLFSTIRKQPGFRKSYVFVDLVAGKPRLPYTGVEEFGSAPHVIYARRRKALRFTVGGRVVFRTAVRHPGTTGSHFLLGSLDLAAG
jgi:hypothetical protein